MATSAEYTLAFGESRPIDSDRKTASVPQECAVRSLTHSMVRGEEPAYRRFFEAYYPRLFRYLLVVTAGNDEASREALQGTFLRVVRHVRVFDDERIFWSWLTRVARTTLYDQKRKHGRYRAFLGRFSEESRIGDGHGPMSDEGGARLCDILDRTLLELPPDERDLLDQKYVRRVSLREIAMALGSTEKAVESRLLRVRRKLKRAILTELRNERGS